MSIYLFTITLLFLFAIIELNYRLTSAIKFLMYTLTYVLLVIQFGFRWETGTDWHSYLYHFENIDGFSLSVPFFNRFEFGYNLFTWLVAVCFSSYTIFLIVHSLLYFLILLPSIKQCANYVFIPLLMYYSFTMGMMGSHRQLIAIAICLYSLRFVFNRNLYQFLLSIFIASNFHVTAILFIPYYFFNRQIKIRDFFVIILFAVILGNTSLPTIFLSGFTNFLGDDAIFKLAFYVDGAKEEMDEYGLTYAGLFKRLIFVSLFIFNRTKLRYVIPYYDLMLNGYIFGLLIYFSFGSSLLVFVSKAGLYFNIMEPLLLSSQVLVLNRKNTRLTLLFVLFIFAFVLFFQSIARYPDLFLPYKGLFINYEYNRIVY